jgi:hypothetical protein
VCVEGWPPGRRAVGLSTRYRTSPGVRWARVKNGYTYTHTRANRIKVPYSQNAAGAVRVGFGPVTESVGVRLEISTLAPVSRAQSQRVFSGTTYHSEPEGGEAVRFGYHKADRRVSACYFNVVDEVFGLASAGMITLMLGCSVSPAVGLPDRKEVERWHRCRGVLRGGPVP